MSKMTFSKKLIFAYTCVVAIPLTIIVFLIMGVIRKSQLKELQSSCETYIAENYETVTANIESFRLYEQLINSNGKLTLFFTAPERMSENEVIETIISECTMLERTLGVMPNIYGLRIFSNNPLIPERWPLFLNSSRENLKELNRWEYDYVATYMGNQYSLMQESVCTTRPLVKNDHEIGYIQVAMKTQDFFPFLYKKQSEYRKNYVFREVLNEKTNQMELIPLSNSTIDKIQTPLNQKQIEQFQKEVYKSKKGNLKTSGKITFREKNNVNYSNWIRVPDMNIILLHTCSSISIFRELAFVQGGILLGLFITVFLLYFFVRYLTSKLMGRIYNLIKCMKQVQNGNLSAKVDVSGNDEVTAALKTYNKMIGQLQRQINKIKEEQQLIADTEMKAMQNQINAHFLYNALETIKMQAVIVGEPEIEESINILGKLMRYCLRWRIHEVTLAQELDYIRAYIQLLNIRNDYVISLQTEVQSEFENVVIAKMCLQPIVENAFFYAIEPLGVDATIKVYTETGSEPDRIWLCVRDFGPGIQEEKLNQLISYLSDDIYERDSKGSIGLKNIQQRLTTFYGKSFRMKIEQPADGGTLIKIPIPIKSKTIKES